MKRSPLLWTLGIALIAFSTQGFQCGSPEFTGAKVYEQQQNWKEAARLYDQETQKNPTNAEAWFRLGRLRGDKLNDDIGMNVAFKAAEKLTKEFDRDIKIMRYNRWASHVNDGINFLRRGSADSTYLFDDAVKAFQHAIDAWPDTAVTYQFLGHSYISKKDEKSAVSSYAKAWEMGKDKDSYKRAGRIYVARGLALKSKFEEANGANLKAMRNLAEIDRGMYKNDVMRMFGPADRIKKDSKNARKEDWTYTKYSLTISLENDKVVKKTISKPFAPAIDSTDFYASFAEFENAVKIFEEIKAYDSRDNENLSLLLQAYVEANRIQEATKAFKLAVDNEPGSKTNHYILGVLYRTVGDFDGAIAQFQEALTIDPEYGDALFDLGATFYNWGVDMLKAAQDRGEDNVEYKAKFKAALPYLEKVAQLRKDDPAVYETLATIYARLGQSDKAVKALDEADRIRKGGK